MKIGGLPGDHSAFAGVVRNAFALFLCSFLVLSAPSAAQTPPPEKIDKLIELLSDPSVKTWLENQAKGGTPAAAAPAQVDQSMTSLLSSRFAAVHQHIQSLIAAMPGLSAQFNRAWIIFHLEFQDSGLVGILALIVGLIAAGLGVDWLARRLTAGYRDWMRSLPHTTPQGRIKSMAARLLYAAIMIGAFTVGSAGVFLAFAWPPLLREIVMSYLTVAIVTRATMMVCRAFLLPPHLKMPHSDELRGLPMSGERAAHWYKWLAINVGWFGFALATLGLLTTFGFDLAGRQVVGIPASFIQLLLLLAAIWLRPRLAPADNQQPVRIGHVAVSWLLGSAVLILWLMWTSGARFGFWFVLAAIVLPAAITFAQRSVYYLLRPPEPDSGGKPIAPVLLTVIDRGIRVALIAASAFFLARVWGLDVSSMAQADSMAVRLLRGGLNAAVILLAADFGWSIIKAVIARKLGETQDTTGESDQHQQARLRTLLPIFQNILFVAILVMAILMVLSSIGIEIGPLIAGAGVVGVAIGFGAQTLVKDIISGMFFLLDDAFRVGEYIESESYKGTVESFSLRSIKLRHHRGYLFTVPFGMLGAVQNMSRDYVIDKFNITVGYDTDIEKARKLIKKVGLELAADPEYAPNVIEPVKMQGVEGFGDYGIQLRIKMKTKPGEQFPMKRKAYVLIRKAFQENGITLPIPTVQVQGGEASVAAAAKTMLAPHSETE